MSVGARRRDRRSTRRRRATSPRSAGGSPPPAGVDVEIARRHQDVRPSTPSRAAAPPAARRSARTTPRSSSPSSPRHGPTARSTVDVHFIGQLQTNKVRPLAGARRRVARRVDRPSLVDELAKRMPGRARPRPGRHRPASPARAAARPDDVDALVERAARRRARRSHGLMTVGPTHGGPEAARPGFRAVRATASTGSAWRVCSMGMSADLEVAVAGGRHRGAHRQRAVRRASPRRDAAHRVRIATTVRVACSGRRVRGWLSGRRQWTTSVSGPTMPTTTTTLSQETGAPGEAQPRHEPTRGPQHRLRARRRPCARCPPRPSYPHARRRADGPAPEPAAGRLQRPAPTDQPAPGVGRRAAPGAGRGPPGDPYTVRPRRFDSAQELADKFKEGLPVIMNLEAADREVSRRLIDFASGLCYALNGSMEKVATGVYLLKPIPSRPAAYDQPDDGGSTADPARPAVYCGRHGADTPIGPQHRVQDRPQGLRPRRGRRLQGARSPRRSSRRRTRRRRWRPGPAPPSPSCRS